MIQSAEVVTFRIKLGDYTIYLCATMLIIFFESEILFGQIGYATRCFAR